MQKIYRILIVIILFMLAVVICLDYFGFHGSILLGKVANGAIVSAVDAFWKLFEGSNAFINFMFIAVISVGLLVGILAIIYKFIKG
jgi:hypothetical protein